MSRTEKLREYREDLTRELSEIELCSDEYETDLWELLRCDAELGDNYDRQ